MRFVSATVAAIFVAVATFGASAAPLPSTANGVKAQSTFELIKSKKKSTKSKKSRKGGKGPGKCGTGMFYKGGKCNKASDKKTS